MKPRAARLRAAAQALGAVCGCLLALLAALSLTLFREGHYVRQLERSGVLPAICANVRQGGRQVAQAAGLRADILDSLVTEEAVRVAVIRRADEIWHGASDQPASPYAGAVAYLQDTLTRESGVLWTDADADLYRNVQLICDDMWRTNTAPPLANLLNYLMQYRRLAWAPMAAAAAMLAGCLWMLVRLCRGWRQLCRALAGLGAAIALGALWGALAIQACGWQTWMPAADPGYGLYCSWFEALPVMLAVCGAALAGGVWLCAAGALAMARRRQRAER